MIAIMTTPSAAINLRGRQKRDIAMMQRIEPIQLS
jgi:hypothetical protein